jgi:C4-dicarboxylate transporter DctM subunit
MINLAIGLFTPPVGINLYVAANITRLPLERVAQGAIPFLISAVIGMAIVAAIPELSQALVIWLR